MPSSSSRSLKPGSIWSRLTSIVHDDAALTAESWFKVQPCNVYRLFGRELLITQPSSSFLVYLLGVLTTVIGIGFLMTVDGQVSRCLWGISLILWGVGALLAGTSYQAFGYQLKCRGRPYVAWTSWWEVIYLIFQQLSINVMLVAVAYSCLPAQAYPAVNLIAVVVSVLYTVMVFYGAFKPRKALITFELMVHVCTPMILFFVGLNGWRYLQSGQMMDLVLLGTWLGLIFTMWLYWHYYKAGHTQKLWAKGIWFSENDVLHVALIVWVAYIALAVAPFIRDIGAV